MTNRYEEKQAARKERLEDRASKVRAESSSVYNQAKGMASAIPFGQPIHIGHYSESRDRNYRDKIHNKFGKAFALQDKAEHLAQRAASVGTGGISSDDPEAVAKLRAELVELERQQERMKQANKAIRTNKTAEAQIAALTRLGYTEEAARDLLTPDFCKRIGYPSYRLSNNNANIRRIGLRIKELEVIHAREDKEEAGKGYTYKEDTEDNRVMFLFEGKPDEETRKLLKAHGFKWSPSRVGKPWVRHLNGAGLANARYVREVLDARADKAEG